jgi:hypothetical protein
MLQTPLPTSSSPYLKRGRLAELVAAIQVMSSTERAERSIISWSSFLDRTKSEGSVAKWTSVFEEHEEFFLVYIAKSERKAALRVRYALKNFDPRKAAILKPEEIEDLPDAERDLLTSKPLSMGEIAHLIDTAIKLNAAAIEERREQRWWIPVSIGFVGAVVGAIVSGAVALLS